MKTLKFAVLLALSSICVWSCKPFDGATLQENAVREPVMGLSALVVEQPNFAQAPPIAEDFILQQLEKPDLEGNNMLFKAVFKREDSRLNGVTSFSVQVSEGMQVLMHDDGRNGDERAGDRVFSAFVKDDPERLSVFLREKNATIERNQQMLTQFSGRSIQKTKVSFIDIEAFLGKKPVSLGGGVATAMVTQPVFDQLKDRSLVITNIGVVQDITRTYNPCVGGTAGGNPNGVWTLKRLMTNMANTPVTGISADDFVKSWLDTEVFAKKGIATSGDVTTTGLSSSTVIRDDLISTSPIGSKRKFISAWLKNSGFVVNQPNINNWKTLLVNKLEFLPVRLLAIVNRLDLRGNFGYTGGSDNSGEGRFVFCFVDSNNGCTSANNGPGTMTIILEYGIPITNCNGLQAYAQKWYNLKNMALGSAAYNTALENITNVFTNANAGGVNKANRSALNHLRTNEFIMSPWNIRDFEINKTLRKLELIHPNKEPMSEANANFNTNIGTKISSLVAFANANSAVIESEGPYAIPNDIKGVDGQMPSPSYFWNGTGTSIVRDSTRHKLSLNTCTGCHAGETKTAFTQIKPANFGTPAPLSAFLTGLGFDDESSDLDTDPMGTFWVKDPANRPTAATATKRGFNDLLRRANDLETLVNTVCGARGTVIGLAEVLRFQPISPD